MNHEFFMNAALEEARKAKELGEIPVGAVIVKDNKIISSAFNLRERSKSALAHAEIIAINEACKVLNNWRLNDCTMYVTLEPCPMCAGAIVNSRISNVYIGTFDPNAGSCGSVLNITQNEALNHWVNIHWLYNEECSNILTGFFKERRNKK